jgi:hypothetical protein
MAQNIFTDPQFLDFIRQALLYILPSDPQVGLATRQHDSRQWRVVWQYFLDVRTTPCLQKQVLSSSIPK